MNRATQNKQPLNSYEPSEASLEDVELKLGRPLTIRLGFKQGSTKYMTQNFKGRTTNPKINTASNELHIHAVDKMGKLLETQLGQGTLQTNINTVDYIQDILTELGYTSDDWVMDAGLQVIKYAWWGGRTAATEIKRAVEAEGGRFYVNQEGKFVFENRQHYNLNDDHKESSYGYDKTNILDLSFDFAEDKLINKINIKVQPYVAQPLGDIWKYASKPFVEAGETITIIADFLPSTNIQTITATTDYTAHDDEDGLGADLTADISITQANYVEKSFITIENTGATDAYITLLKIRGQELERTGGETVTYEDSVSIASYGERAITLDNPYFQDAPYARILAEHIVDQYKDYGTRMNLSIRANTTIQLGDVVTVYAEDTGVNYLMRVIGNKISYNRDGMNQELRLRKVLDVELLDYFIVGTSSIGSDNAISP